MSPDRFSHDELQERLLAFSADALGTEERAAVDAHLARCATCRQELERMRQLLVALAAQRRLIAGNSIAGNSIADAVMVRIASRPPMRVASRTYWSPPDTTPASAESLRDDPEYEWWGPGAPSNASAHRMAAAARPREIGHGQRRDQSRPLVAAVALLAVVSLLAALLASRLAPSSPAIPVPGTGDWRAAYLGSDGLTHIVSATGERRTSVALPGANPQGLPQSPRASISADGRYLASIRVTSGDGSGPVTVLDLASGQVTTLDLMAAELHWAPDAPRFASSLSTLEGGTVRLSITLTDMRTNQRQDLQLGPTLDHLRVTRLVGWIDAHHLAIIADPGGKGLTVPLVSLDLTTGGITTLATLVQPPEVFLSPDGKRVFVAPTFWAPSAGIVDTTTGSMSELPGITATFASRLKHLDNLNLAYGGNWAYQWAWQPGTHTIALSLSASSIPNEGETQPVTQEAGVWLIDLDRDHATSLNRDRYPLAWTPDGRTLFMSDIPAATAINAGFSVGSHLYALSPVAPNGRSRELAGDMVMFFGLTHST